MEGVTWPDLKTKRIPQYVLGVINKNNCWLTGKAYGRFKMHGHSHSISFFLFFNPTSEQEEKDRLQKNLQPEKPFDEVCLPQLPVNTACHWALVIQQWLNVIRAIGCLRSFLMRSFGHSTYAVQINTKLAFLFGSGWWEWVICLAYERCIHFHS